MNSRPDGHLDVLVHSVEHVRYGVAERLVLFEADPDGGKRREKDVDRSGGAVQKDGE